MSYIQVDTSKEITFYDSVTGKPLFIAPRERSFEEFRKESEDHGWPSFRDQEVAVIAFNMKNSLLPPPLLSPLLYLSFSVFE